MENQSTEVDAYISGFPPQTQTLLMELRQTIKKSAPEALEVISYKMPAYKMNGILLYFAAYSKHIGFYPTGSAIATFKDHISKYKWAKGSVQFPLDEPLPLKLISEIVEFRVKENTEKLKKKKPSPK